MHKQKEIILKKLEDSKENSDEDEIKSLKSLLNSVNEAIKVINRKHKNIVWPASSQNGEMRTMEKVLEIVEKIENNETLSLDEAKGIIGRSLFLDIPYFNYLLDITVEYLHGVCLGVVKKLLELTFNVGGNRQRNTTRKLSDVSQFNELMCLVLLPRECSRRARKLDLTVMKGQEYRNIILFYFVIVIDCIEENAKERRVWLLLAYMIRMCVLPNEEYEVLDPDVINYCGRHFYTLYEKLFNTRNCSYNTHVVGSHMPSIRAHGPLTLTSAFGFESFYGEMRRSFTPGTLSPLKQIFNKILIKRTISSHCCKSPIYYSPKDTAMECNSYIYTYINNEYEIYKIVSMEDITMDCFKVGKYEASFQDTPTLIWGKVGVFKCGGIADEIVSINSKDIAGKVIKVQNFFLTCPINVLEEK